MKSEHQCQNDINKLAIKSGVGYIGAQVLLKGIGLITVKASLITSWYGV